MLEEWTMNKLIKTTLTGVACLTMSTVSFTATANTESYPDRTVRYIVPFSAGGATDTVARLLAEKLSETWDGSVVVENRAGASGNVGTSQVARATPDGYTMLMTINSFTINQS